jgi:phospholipid/cholesterol/gamma-HCH transport system permease protein
MKPSPALFINYDPASQTLNCTGEWVLKNIKVLEQQLNALRLPKQAITVNGANVSKMDSAGAWLISSSLKKNESQQANANFQNFSQQQQKLLSLIEEREADTLTVPPPNKPGFFEEIGKYTLEQITELRDFFSFTGMLTMEMLRLVGHPKKFRFAALVSVLDSTGLRALPIIALLSFMIGVVMSYQMGTQLKTYGANLYIVDFIGLSVLREFGPLLTAIMVAGRTGSAFTAQLGTMKVNQEIDALNTMGVTPAELLLIPRLLGLLIALPLLAMWADVFGILGGMLMAHDMLSVQPYDFLLRFQHVIPLKTLIIGLCKAPVFALIIGSVGCFEGMRVASSADSVGKQTTRSVVLSIFFIIVADAIFSILFSKMKL